MSDMTIYEARRLRAVEHITQRAINLIEEAKEYGVVVTIETQPRQPLAMGNYRMVIGVRKERGKT